LKERSQQKTNWNCGGVKKGGCSRGDRRLGTEDPTWHGVLC